MKKCPECGNPSYDGARVCGNCGHKFPKPKTTVPKTEEKNDYEEFVTFFKKNKVIITSVLIIAIVIILGIFLSGGVNETIDLNTSSTISYSDNGFSFNYPSDWEKANLTDFDRPNAIFFKDKNESIIKYYNITTSSSLRDITSERISSAAYYGQYVDLIKTINISGANATDIILYQPNTGEYTRYITILNEGYGYIFRITGDSLNAINSNEINNMLNNSIITK